MTVTDDLIKKIWQHKTDKNPKPTLNQILSDYESIWKKNVCIDLYKKRVAACKKILIWEGNDAYTILDTNTIIIKVEKTVPAKNVSIPDTIYKKMGEKGKFSGHHDIACALIFELGNCLLSNDFKLIQTRFFLCSASLHSAGELFTQTEARGTIGYVTLMRAIAAQERPYQANRDLYKYRNANDDNQIIATFCNSSHNADPISGSMDFATSIQGYTYELVAHAKKKEIVKLAEILGKRELRLDMTEEKAWNDLVDWLAQKLAFNEFKLKYRQLMP